MMRVLRDSFTICLRLNDTDHGLWNEGSGAVVFCIDDLSFMATQEAVLVIKNVLPYL